MHDVETQQNVIWTIGHSTHSIEEFIAILRSFQIERLLISVCIRGQDDTHTLTKRRLKLQCRNHM